MLMYILILTILNRDLTKQNLNLHNFTVKNGIKNFAGRKFSKFIVKFNYDKNSKTINKMFTLLNILLLNTK